jgi:hypothetical protein
VKPSPTSEHLAGRTPAGEWPPLPLDGWADTYATLHMWTQVVGKIRLACAPTQNHSWHVTLYPTPRGLCTGPIPDGPRTFEMHFDFIAHQLRVTVSDGSTAAVALEPISVAEFHRLVMEALSGLGIHVKIWTRPQEVERAVPFEQDFEHAAYDPDAALRHWQILTHTERVLQNFRSDFVGKVSPIHWFWGGFDLAHTRFSGRTAPTHPGGIPNMADRIAVEAYSHEVYSVGFWPGGPAVPEPAYYAYAYPEPDGFAEADVRPEGARYSEALREFILPYDAVRTSPDPDGALLAFARSTYDAAARLGNWPRDALERRPDPSTG